MSRSVCLSSCTALLLHAGVAISAAAQQPPEMVLTDLDGATVTGAVTGFADDTLQLTTAAGESRDFALDDLTSIAPRTPIEAPPRSAQLPGRLWLRSGTELPFEPAGETNDDGFLVAELGGGATVELPALRLNALRFEAAEADPSGGFARALAAPDRTADLLFAHDRRRDRITRLPVRVIGFTADRLRVEFRGREQTLPLGNVHGVVFGTDNGLAPSPLQRPFVVLELSDARRLRGRLERFDAGGLAIRTADDLALSVPIERLAALTVRSAKVAWLSELEPTAVAQVPAFEQVRPWLRDAAPAGPGLVLGDERYARGVCLIPRTTLSYAVEPGAFDVFDAVVGIDARAGRYGSALVTVALDDEVVLSLTLDAGDTPRPIRLPLGDATRLTLTADFGERYDLGDHCAFARARLLRL